MKGNTTLNPKNWIYLISFCVLAVMASCAKQTDIENLQRQIDDIRNTQIASVNSQILSITSSISTIQETQIKLSDYISELKIALADLQSKEEKDIEYLKSSTTSLEQKDVELKILLDNLNAYVDTGIMDAKSWALATFATLEQYAAIQGELSKIKQDLSAVQLSISSIDERLSSEIQKTRTELISLISASETSMKSWVNEKLTGYYTIAEIEAKLAALKSANEKENKDLQKEIDDLEFALASIKSDLTQAYKNAITTAIDTNNGFISSQISSSIATAMESINTSLSQISSSISSLERRVSDLEKNVAAIISSIQSVTVIPTYNDGSVAIAPDETEIRFEIFPREASKAIAENWTECLSIAVINTETKASLFSPLEILYAYDNGEILIVTVDGKKLGNYFFSGEKSANARLLVSDGKISRSSEYFSITPVDIPPKPTPKNLSLEQTANCYIVNRPGDFYFNASVKGNSMTPLDGIPYSAAVLWESFGTSETPKVRDLISDISFIDNEIHFSVPKDCKDGNAMISVKDKSGVILWSWHIWICKGYNPTANNQHHYYNNAGIVMDRNLGALSANMKDVKSLGLLYQWGRKDPFLNSRSAGFWDGPAGSTLNSWPKTVNSVDCGTISYAIQNPTTFIIYNEITRDWLFNAGGMKDDSRWAIEKTIYDPCPPGWRVPDGDQNGVWAKALGNNRQKSIISDWGINFSGVFCDDNVVWYPATGFRQGDTPSSTGSLYNQGNYGHYWSCSSSIKSSYSLRITSGTIDTHLDDACRANAFAIRCIAD